MSEIAQTDNFNDRTNIKVVGVGGAGGNAVNRMIAEGLQNVQFVAINTDAKDLLRSDADVKISLNDASSRGLGAGADPERGSKAAQDHQSDIEEALKGADMVFVTCGEGGGTGTGASPIVARAAHQQGALTIAVVTRPFTFEGPQRSASADLGIENLRKEVDALIVIPNDRLLELSDRTIGIVDAFKTADSALLAGVQGITDLITMNSYIHVDFSDVTAILRGAGTALFGIKLQEASAATELVRKAIHPEAQIIWGLALDDAYGDEVRVTVIAAGFDADSKNTNVPSMKGATTAASIPASHTTAPVTPTHAHDQQQPVAPSIPVRTQPSANTPMATTNPAARQVPDFALRKGGPASMPIDDETSEHDIVSSGDLGDLDIPDFLR